MRVVLSFMLVLLVLGMAGFLLTNPDERVDVTLLGTNYSDVSLVNVVFASFALGASFVGVIAVIEGASLRLRNRRLNREKREMETDILALRTQSPAAAQPAGSTSRSGTEPAAPGARKASGGTAPRPSAPVYGTEEPNAGTRDPDEDIYSGGRAV